MTGRAFIPRNWRGFIFPVAAILVIEVAMRTIGVESQSLARPSEILRAAIGALADGSMLTATFQTLVSAFGGLIIGGGIGLVLGILMAMFPPLYWIAEVPFETLRPIPSIALLPLVLLIFGLGFAMEITLVAKTALWPVFFLTLTSVRGVKRRLIEFSSLIRMGLLERMAKIILPAALPGIFLGFRIAMGAALIVAVTVEIAANPLGLGYAMMLAQERLQPALMFAYLFWIGIVGWIFNALTVLLQKRCFAPRQSGRAAT